MRVRMKRKSLDKLAQDPKFISGVYNYCDRWCERCSFSDRCLVYAEECADDSGDPAERDLANQKFWDKLHRNFRETLKMVQTDAKKRGIDLDDPKLEAAVARQQRAEKRLAAKNLPLAQLAQ